MAMFVNQQLCLQGSESGNDSVAVYSFRIGIESTDYRREPGLGVEFSQKPANDLGINQVAPRMVILAIENS